MKIHTKIYLKYFRYDENSFISCEICKRKAIDIHHINSRGMGGSLQRDKIENLMALCRECHIKYGDKKQHKEMLKEVHSNFMKYNKK